MSDIRLPKTYFKIRLGMSKICLKNVLVLDHNHFKNVQQSFKKTLGGNIFEMF